MTYKFQNKYRIPARAAWHGYDGGVYFVTICTQNREHFFGEIRRDEPVMVLSEIGKIAEQNLQNVTTHYPYAEIPLFVVMPDHIHAIVIIDGDAVPYDRRNATNDNCWDAARDNCRDAVHHVPTRVQTEPNISQQMTNIANMQGWLSVVIGGLKRAITHAANKNNMAFGWQTRFHDHIVRNQDELNRIARYIENNIPQWADDELKNKTKTI